MHDRINQSILPPISLKRSSAVRTHTDNERGSWQVYKIFPEGRKSFKSEAERILYYLLIYYRNKSRKQVANPITESYRLTIYLLFTPYNNVSLLTVGTLPVSRVCSVSLKKPLLWPLTAGCMYIQMEKDVVGGCS